MLRPGDVMAAELETVLYAQMLILFAPHAVPAPSHLPLLLANLASRQPALRQAAAATLRHLAEQVCRNFGSQVCSCPAGQAGATALWDQGGWLCVTCIMLQASCFAGVMQDPREQLQLHQAAVAILHHLGKSRCKHIASHIPMTQRLKNTHRLLPPSL